MKKTIRMLQAIALAGGMSLALAGSGYAQDQGASPPTPRGDHAGPGHGWDPARMRERMEERRQHRLQVLHDAIGVRPDQDGPWQTFVAAMRPPAREAREGRRDDGARAELTTPQRLDRMAQRMSERQARFQQRAGAIKAFYLTLDPRQQKTFDALVGARFGRGGMGHGGRMGGWGHRGRMGGAGARPDGERG